MSRVNGNGIAFWIGRAGLALPCALLIVWILACYPLSSWPLAITAAAYGMALWRWPALFLVVLPIILPALDLGAWTGWMMIGEADLFVLATVGVLIARDPPRARDVLPPGWRGRVLLALIAVYTLGTVIGLLAAARTEIHSDNAFLRPDNALRLVKGIVEALALSPFLRQRQRTHADIGPWLGLGMGLGLAAVALEVVAERALFVDILDFTTDYRVVGPFSSMRTGGGHIGGYVAMALPFALAGIPGPNGSPVWKTRIVAGGMGVYALAVTFARTAYAAALGGAATVILGLILRSWRRGGLSPAVAIVPAGLVILGLGLAASSGIMAQRFGALPADLLVRETNWRDGWAVHDGGVLSTVFGMGLGTYQRTMLARAPNNRPSDLSIVWDAAGPFVSIRAETAFFLGQKITPPRRGDVHLIFRFRADDPKAVALYGLCDKVLLYSDQCRGGQVKPRATGVWETASVWIPAAGLGAPAFIGLLNRPVELSFSTPAGTTLSIRDARLIDVFGRSLLTNGDFTSGLNLWGFTDDTHTAWRIKNQYLMLLFELGVTGLAAFLVLSGLAFAGGVRAAIQGEAIGAAVAGAVIAFLISGFSDDLLEVPRLATLYFLICWTGLLPGMEALPTPLRRPAEAAAEVEEY